MSTSCEYCHLERREPSASLAQLRGGLHLGDVHVLEAALSPRVRLGSHAHAHARFGFVLAGWISESFADRSLRCEKDTVSFHPPVLEHTNEVSPEGARILFMEVCDGRTPELAELVRSLPAPFAVSHRRMRDVAVELSRLLRSEDLARPILVESLVLEILSRCVRTLDKHVGIRESKPPAWLEDFSRLVSEGIDGSLTLGGVASLLRVTPRQLATALNRHRGTTFVAYVRNRRLERAKELLARSDLPLSEVALSTGFSDQSHLTRRFRAAFGVTPGAFRRRSGT